VSVPKQIGWIVDTDGAVTKYEPRKVIVPATRGERHAQYRIGMSRALEILTKAGFYGNAGDQSQNAISVQRGKLMFDFSIKEPANIVYVTSHTAYDPKKGNARRVSAADVMGCEYVIQVIGSKESGSSTMPVYIPLPKNQENPADYVVFNIIKTLQSMVGVSELQGIDLQALSDHSQPSLDSGSSEV